MGEFIKIQKVFFVLLPWCTLPPLNLGQPGDTFVVVFDRAI